MKADMPGRKAVVDTARKYRVAIKAAQIAREAWRDARIADARAGHSSSSTATSSAYNTMYAAEEVEKASRNQFLSAVNACVPLRWRLLDEFAPDPS